jgi:hypothetical protein
MSPDETAAHLIWKKYHAAIKRYDLDKDGEMGEKKIIDYMQDAFFAGFYTGRDYQRGKK